jgi:hypothetical protein
MKTFLKVTGVTLLAVVALAAIGVSWLALRKPAQRPAAAETIERTPERVARGEYLVHHVTDCVGCHSEHTLAYALPIKPGSEGARGFVWDQKFGFPGVVAAANITPDPETGLGAWTDGERSAKASTATAKRSSRSCRIPAITSSPTKTRRRSSRTCAR